MGVEYCKIYLCAKCNYFNQKFTNISYQECSWALINPRQIVESLVGNIHYNFVFAIQINTTRIRN